MAVTKLNAAALPYHSPSCHPHPIPLPSHPYMMVYHYHAGGDSLPFPVVASCSCVPLLVPAPRHTHSLPPPLEAVFPVLCNAVSLPTQAAAAPVPFGCKAAPLSPPPGCPPHKLMLLSGDGVEKEKLQAQAAAKKQAAVPENPGQEPAAATAPHPGRRVVPPRGLHAGTRGRSKDLRRWQTTEPVARTRPARSPSPVFTTRPPSPTPAPEWQRRQVTTVMIRNIPNKLTPGEMMRLLDDHCARANKKKKRGNARSAYDFLYLRMDFSACSNMGYAFVNLTTAEAARGLHYALDGSHWKVFGSKKVIDIRVARIQGKEALVRHFSGSTFACHTDEFLPAVFSPPRDGVAPSPAEPKHVGRRVDPLLPLAAQLPPRQHLAWRPVCVDRG